MRRAVFAAVLLGVGAAWGAAPARPRLAVLLVVDQLTEEAFARHLPAATGGFRRMVDEGFRFTDGRYETAPPMTGPGHATLATGAYPNVHGIVSNDWIDARTHASVYVTDDARCAPPGGRGIGPGQLKAPTLGDVLKAASPRSRVVSVSGKDRSAVLMAGKAADAAFWISDAAPQFATSRCYGDGATPAWVDAVNARVRAAIDAGLTWCPSHQPCTSALSERPFQTDVAGFGASWPHQVSKASPPRAQAESLLLHPLLNAALVDLGLGAVEAMGLGQRDAPDLLAISFSSFDEVAHVFGLDSLEVDEMFADLSVSQCDELMRLLTHLRHSIEAHPGRSLSE